MTLCSRLVQLPTLLMLGLLALLVGCSAPADKPVTYDSNSWKTLIDPGCQAYFDGCHQCRSAEGAQMGVCTRKACVEYQKPYCMDQASREYTRHDYTCEGGETFLVFYGEYRASDMRVKLENDEVWFSNTQTRTAHRLKQVPSASGARYADDQLIFWVKGDEAIVLIDGELSYQGCQH